MEELRRPKRNFSNIIPSSICKKSDSEIVPINRTFFFEGQTRLLKPNRDK